MSQLVEVWALLEVTAYTSGFESTGKHPGHPLYGITYSGRRVEEGRTVAAGSGIPIDTLVFIPDLAHWPNGGKFVVEDRGGAISNAHLDIYIENLARAREWGRKHIEVMFLVPQEKAAEITRLIDRDRYRWKDKAALESYRQSIIKNR